jgi:phage gpG-like protein
VEMQYNATIPNFDAELRALETHLFDLSRHAAKIAHTHYTNRFLEQNWDGKPWQARKMTQHGKARAILIQDGNLRDSIRYTSIGTMAVINTDAVYAQIHNEGGEIVVTEKMRKYFWAMYYQSKEKIQLNKKGEARNNKHNARHNDEADYFKWLALKKVGDKLKIPQRQFMDMPNATPTDELRHEIEAFVKAQLDKVLPNH